MNSFSRWLLWQGSIESGVQVLKFKLLGNKPHSWVMWLLYSWILPVIPAPHLFDFSFKLFLGCSLSSSSTGSFYSRHFPHILHLPKTLINFMTIYKIFFAKVSFNHSYPSAVYRLIIHIVFFWVIPSDCANIQLSVRSLQIYTHPEQGCPLNSRTKQSIH